MPTSVAVRPVPVRSVASCRAWFRQTGDVTDGIDVTSRSIWVSWDTEAVARFPDGGPTHPESFDAGWCTLAADSQTIHLRVDHQSFPPRMGISGDITNIASPSWQASDVDRSVGFADRFEPPRELLDQRVDKGTDPIYQPASLMGSAQ